MPSGGCNASPATVTLEPWQRDSGHLAVSTPAGFSDTESGFNPVRTATRLLSNHQRRGVQVPARRLARKWEGPRRTGQDFKPDLVEPGIRGNLELRGLSGPGVAPLGASTPAS